MISKTLFPALALAALFCTCPALAQDAAAAAAPEPTAQAEAAPAATAAEPAAAAPAAAPAAFSEKVAAAIGTPPEGKAHIVFFRPSKFVGAAIGFKVRENGVELGKLKNGSYFVLPVEPGAHTYVVHSEAKDVTNIEAEAGETYFLVGTVTMGVMAGHPNLSPADAAAFEAALAKMKKTAPL